MTTWLFQIEQYCKKVSVSVDADKIKLAVSRLEKDALTWWRQYSQSHPDAFTTLGWDDFKV